MVLGKWGCLLQGTKSSQISPEKSPHPPPSRAEEAMRKDEGGKCEQSASELSSQGGRQDFTDPPSAGLDLISHFPSTDLPSR